MMRSKILKTIGIVFLFLFLLLAAASLFLRTDYSKNLAKGLLEKAVSSATNGTFTVGELNIDLIRGLKLKDVSLKIEQKPFAQIEEASVQYSLPLILNESMLFSKVIPIDTIALRGVKLNLIKEKKGTWNFDKIGSKEKKEEKEDEDREKSPPAWSIILENALLEDANINVLNEAKDEVTKVDIDKLHFSLSLTNIIKKVELNLKSASLRVSPQEINIARLSTKGVYTKDKAEITGLELNLNGADIKLDAQVSDFKQPAFMIEASAYGYELEELGTINAEIEGSGKYISQDNVNANMTISMPDSRIRGKKMSALIEKIRMNGSKLEIEGGAVRSEFGQTTFSGNADLKRILTKEGINEFDLEISLKDLRISEILEIIEKKKIANIQDKDLSGELNANIDVGGRWKDMDDLVARANLENVELTGNQLGEVDLEGWVEATKSHLELDLHSKLNRVNLAQILNKNEFESNINSSLNLRGSVPLGKDLLENLEANVQGDILKSTFSGIRITKGRIDTSYRQRILSVNSVTLISDAFKLEAQGTGTRDKGVNFNYAVGVNNLDIVTKFVPSLELRGSLNASGKVVGDVKSPRVTLSATAADFMYKNDIEAQSIKVEGESNIDLKNPRLLLDSNMTEIKFQDREIESAKLRAESVGNDIAASILITEDPEKVYEADIRLRNVDGQEKSIIINKIKLAMQDTVIENRDPMNVTILPKQVIVKSLNLYHKDNALLGDADINFSGAVSADLRFDTINFSDISEALNVEPPFKGTTSGFLSLRGTLETPQLDVKINARNVQFREFDSDSTNLELSYQERKLNFGLFMTEDNKPILQAEGSADINLNLKSVGESLDDAVFQLTLNSSGIELTPISKFSGEIKKIDGVGAFDLTASGTIKNPNINGQLRLKDVNLALRSLRNEFKVVTALVDMQGQRGFLRTLEIQTGEGKASIEGDFDLETISYNLNAKMDNFRIEPKGIAARLDGDLTMKGSEGRLKITGDARVRRARIRIPELESKEVEEIKFVDAEEEEFTIEAAEPSDYFRDNVAMDLKVYIPGNAWVRGKGANVELRGDFGIVKNYGNPLVLTGNISTVRGTYEFLGKLFKIEEGRVTFQGTPEINPFLNIRALYEVSDVSVFINIRGTVEKPEIKLSSDPAMQETDIFSYLVFGKSSASLGAGERISLEEQAGQILGRLAVGELKGIVGEKLALDVISVRGGSSGPELEVGKYLTDDLYLAYERGASQSSTATPIPTNSVRAEYRLYDWLTLESEVGGEQAGGDVFFQFEYTCPFF